MSPTDMTFSEEWLREYSLRTGKNTQDVAAGGHRPSGTGRSKYGNRKTTRGGEQFDSEHEARVYDEILLRLRAGEMRGFCRQQSFPLPGGVKYIADFVILNNDQTYTVVDAKSEATRKDKVYCLKKRQMRECYGIVIQEV